MRRFRGRGNRIKLGGFPGGDHNAVGLVDSAGKPTTQVLVVPPNTEPEVAKRALDAAAVGGSTDRPDEMLERARTA